MSLIDLETFKVFASNRDNDDSILAIGIDSAAGLAVTSRFAGVIEARALPSFEVLARLSAGDKAHAVAILRTQIAFGDSRGSIHFLKLQR